MLDINRFISDGVGNKKDSHIKSLKIATSAVTVASLGVDPNYSIALPLAFSAQVQTDVATAYSVGNIAAGGSLSGIFPQLIIEFDPKYVKSKQQGSYSGTGDTNVTINSVTQSNCLVLAYGGSNMRTSSQARYCSFSASLTSPTNLFIDATMVGTVTWTPSVNWVVLEFIDGVL